MAFGEGVLKLKNNEIYYNCKIWFLKVKSKNCLICFEECKKYLVLIVVWQIISLAAHNNLS